MNKDINPTLALVLKCHSGLALLYGLTLLLLTRPVINMLSIDAVINPSAISVVRLFAVLLLAISYITWFAAQCESVNIQRHIAYAMLFYTLSGVIISSIGQYQGIWTWMGFSSILTYLLLFVGYVYGITVKQHASI